ncbi:hypothetical protein JR065_18815 [Xanthomonas sp. AmX2]|uniref:hypothetical protein n=1 Tax=Xanthomonas sp. TaxID=29446 RepID=UPI00197F0FCF|nr:hypothetical protein [Xanthomonas sp.]MBN6152396.1 hypothetical protein [Xanthomonas sp.]
MKIYTRRLIFSVYYLVGVAIFTQMHTAAASDAIPRLQDGAPDAIALSCLVTTRGNSHHEYTNPGRKLNPTIEDLSPPRLIERPFGLLLNKAQCDRFLAKREGEQLFSDISTSDTWYERSEFIHESELIPIKRWTTRYIYYNTYLSYVGSELMQRKEEHRQDLLGSYAAYSLQTYKDRLLQFSQDGYFFDKETGLRWRIMMHPYRPPDDPLEPRLTAIDESGRYLPRGLPGTPAGYAYRYSCTREDDGGYACGYSPKPSERERVEQSPYYGRITQIKPAFIPMRIEPERITILKRVSPGEPFRYGADEWDVEDSLFFYANFDDPIRPVYFAPGLLLRDEKIVAKGKLPKKSDFVQEEICLTDCPEDIAWQVPGAEPKPQRP